MISGNEWKTVFAIESPIDLYIYDNKRPGSLSKS